MKTADNVKRAYSQTEQAIIELPPIWFGVLVDGVTWLQDATGRIIAHESRAVMQAQCAALRNPLACVKEF